MESILIEQLSTRLSLAVSVVDDYTGRQPSGDIEIALGGKKALVNPGGHHLFLDVAGGEYTLNVQNEYYFGQEHDITIPRSGEPVIELTLKPTPAYPFPRGATLIRGIVRDNHGEPVPEAKVEVIGKEIENKTTENGEFVLYFKNLTEDDIIKIGGKRYVRRNNSRRLMIKASHPAYKNKTNNTEVEEGTMVSLNFEIRRKGG
jgi:hypothetical protein